MSKKVSILEGKEPDLPYNLSELDQDSLIGRKKMVNMKSVIAVLMRSTMTDFGDLKKVIGRDFPDIQVFFIKAGSPTCQFYVLSDVEMEQARDAKLEANRALIEERSLRK
jgi:hypothetical protein